MHAEVEVLDRIHPHADAHRFNDDLLLEDADRDFAKTHYEAIYHALYHEALCKTFNELDPKANSARKRSRTWGSRAVVLVSVALLLAVSEPLYAQAHTLALILAALSGLCGIAGAGIAKFGVLHARQKRAWLENRLRTEKLRNFHFRTMLKLSHLLLSDQKEEYLRQRDKEFDFFCRNELHDISLQLDQIVDSDSFHPKGWDTAPMPPTLPGIAIKDELARTWRSA